ncbi:MAG: type III pantothenate kinase [Anaerolineales bacterium]|nr:type III pantothenate kinase [Anaerolineales bacterium]
MLLAIDIGNSNLTLGVCDGQAWQRQWRLLTVQEKTADEYGIVLKDLLYDAGLETAVTHIILSSVVPRLTATLNAACRQYLGHTPLEVGLHLDLGIRVATDVPEQVGMDRIVNAAAAYHLHPGPSIVLDMGTATKFDVVTAAGELVGGVIAPGLQLTADALASRAAKLGQVALEAPPQTIGRNTIHAIQSGLVFGYVGLCEGSVARLRTEHPDQGQPIRILGTGGLIHLIADHTNIIDHVDPWLTLTGLRLIHERVTR